MELIPSAPIPSEYRKVLYGVDVPTTTIVNITGSDDKLKYTGLR